MTMKKAQSYKDKILKPVTEAYLERAAIYYLERYSSCQKNLERILGQKCRRRNENNEAPSEQQLGWISAVSAKCARLGYVDDGIYARTRAAAMHRTGKPSRMIKMALRQKGVGDDDINKALQVLRQEEGEETDRLAAITYARRRRFGPYRTKEGDESKMKKEIGSMARAGFDFDIVRIIIEAKTVEELIDWAEG